jgi:hypothetical protein
MTMKVGTRVRFRPRYYDSFNPSSTIKLRYNPPDFWIGIVSKLVYSGNVIIIDNWFRGINGSRGELHIPISVVEEYENKQQ